MKGKTRHHITCKLKREGRREERREEKREKSWVREYREGCRSEGGENQE